MKDLTPNKRNKKLTEKKRILAIDFGKARIGFAISDPLGMFAIPLVTLKNDGKIWNGVKSIFDEYDIGKVVLGYPLKEDGSKSDITLLVESFKKTLEKKIKMRAELFDERYSSSIAKERVLASVVSKKKRRNKGLIDKNAAAVILEDYLQSVSR